MTRDAAAWLLIGAVAAAASGCAETARAADSTAPPTPITDSSIARGWRVARTVDCARCHGKHHEGLAAPSIVAYAGIQGRDAFARIVLDGDPPRGMPGYAANPDVADAIDDLYRYFAARARGEIRRDDRPGMK